MEKLDRLLADLEAGEIPKASVSELCAAGLAAGRPDVLPAPYDRPGEAWRRLNEEQRAWVRRISPERAGEAAAAAEHAETAWH